MNRHRIVKKEIKGDVSVAINSQYNNLNADNVVIEENVTARLYGTIRKNLVIKNEAKVYLHGIVLGSIDNKGGELHIYKQY